ncbi:MAG: SAM-dependent methyltransferase [Candidatus Pacebacteria bacterium]|nr:SAM-dependent methyltransferase [Candidatus Paceibacterota bacterium]
MPLKKNDSSFRDPSGFIFHREQKIYRQINKVYKEHYDHLMESGLYDELVEDELLVRHQEEKIENSPDPVNCYKIIKPEIIPFISYPYEWCFDQLRDAALLTLCIQKKALEKGMFLKDASAFNVQFVGSRPIFIDTLSFEKYKEGKPWIAYQQFCQHFLAPLALMCYKDITLGKMSRIFLDGIPLKLASELLPFSTYFRFSLLTNIHLHAKAQTAYESKGRANYQRILSKRNLLALIDNLERTVRSLSWKPAGTEWVDYYNDTNYSDKSFEHKKKLVAVALAKQKPKVVWDVGANEGVFSIISSEQNIYTLSIDIDPGAVQQNYIIAAKSKTKHLLPLIMDISNSSPALGWGLEERSNLLKRGPADMIIALALIHHLTIGGNAPFEVVARFFRSMGRSLIIEFVPKNDSQVKRLLMSREDVFSDYTQENFEEQFSKYFSITKKVSIDKSERILYIME